MPWTAALDEESHRIFQTHHATDRVCGLFGMLQDCFFKRFRLSALINTAQSAHFLIVSAYQKRGTNNAPTLYTRCVMGLKNPSDFPDERGRPRYEPLRPAQLTACGHEL
jgi:hypothetical protein